MKGNLESLVESLTPAMKEKLAVILLGNDAKKKSSTNRRIKKEIDVTDVYTCTLCGNSYTSIYKSQSNAKDNAPRKYEVSHCNQCMKHLMKMPQEVAIDTLIRHFTRRMYSDCNSI